jgi:hypothetical protein
MPTPYRGGIEEINPKLSFNQFEFSSLRPHTKARRFGVRDRGG